MRLLLFEQFIQEKLLLEAKINISSTILDVLKNLVKSKYSRKDWVKWSELILTAVESGVDYPNNEIEYLYSDSGKIFQKYRGKEQEVKLGRTLQKILISIEPEIILGYPDFGDFLSYIEGGLLPTDEYVLVSGDDIAKYYDTASTNLVDGSTLFKSCMKGKDPNTFNLYTKNSDVISLLVHLDGGKVSTRALVWKLDGQGDVDYFVDRIYSNDDPLTKIVGIEKFIESKFPGKKYAIKQRDENWIDGVNIKLFLKNLDFTLYPYVDSFSYLYFPMKNLDIETFIETLQMELNPDGGFLSNKEELEKCPEYLRFELLDHKFATRRPLNCKIIDEEKRIYYYLGDPFNLFTQEQRGQYAMKMAQKDQGISEYQFVLLEPDQRFKYAMKRAETGQYFSNDQFELLTQDQRFQYAMEMAEKGWGILYDQFKLLTQDQRFQWAMKMAQKDQGISEYQFVLLEPDQRFKYAMKRAETGQYFLYDQFELLTPEQRFQYAMKMVEKGYEITNEKFKLLTPEQRFQYAMKMVEKIYNISNDQFELLTQDQRFQYAMKMAQNGRSISNNQFELLTQEQMKQYVMKTKFFTKS
jgi:hypothetical protein